MLKKAFVLFRFWRSLNSMKMTQHLQVESSSKSCSRSYPSISVSPNSTTDSKIRKFHLKNKMTITSNDMHVYCNGFKIFIHCIWKFKMETLVSFYIFYLYVIYESVIYIL